MRDHNKFAKPLNSTFCFPKPFLYFSMFDELVVEKYINGFQKSEHLLRYVILFDKRTVP